MGETDSLLFTPRRFAGFILLRSVFVGLIGLLGLALAWSLAGAGLLDDVYLGTVLQFFKAAVSDHLAGIEPGDLSEIVVGSTGGDVAGLRLAVLDNPHEGLRAIVLNGRRVDEGDVFERVDQEAGVDELVGEESAAFVIEDGAHFDGAGGGVDEVISGGELALGDHLALGAIIGLHFERLSLVELGDDLLETVFGDGEDDCDGLKLRDDRENGAARGGDEIAGIDQTETDAAGNRR